MTAGAGNRTRISWSQASTLNHWTISETMKQWESKIWTQMASLLNSTFYFSWQVFSKATHLRFTGIWKLWISQQIKIDSKKRALLQSYMTTPRSSAAEHIHAFHCCKRLWSMDCAWPSQILWSVSCLPCPPSDRKQPKHKEVVYIGAWHVNEAYIQRNLILLQYHEMLSLKCPRTIKHFEGLKISITQVCNTT